MRPPLSIPELLSTLRRLAMGDALASARLEGMLRGRSALALRTVQRALREPRFALDRAGLQLDPSVLPPVGWGPASCQRDGRRRQEAVERLQRLPGTVALGFLALRLNDPFAPLRELAASILRRRLATDPVEDVVWVLPLLDASAPRQHLRPSDWEPVLLARDLSTALLRALEHPTAELRRSAFRWCVRHGPPVPSEAFEALLTDPDPAVRRGVALAAMDGDEALQERVRSHPDPHVRLLGLQSLQHDADRLLLHLFDPRANNRFHVRQWLAALGVEVRPRERALAALEDPERVVGALGLLADVGRGADLPRVEVLLGHGKAVVRREARRTVGMLEAYEGGVSS